MADTSLESSPALKIKAKWYSSLFPQSAERVFVAVYMGLLSAEYAALNPEELPPDARELYEQLGRELADWRQNGNVKVLDWMELCTLETSLLRFLSPDAMRIKLALVQERLRDLVGPQDYARYESLILPDTGDKGEALRECLKQLVGEFHFECQIRLQREQLRVKLARFAVLGIVIVAAVIAPIVTYFSLPSVKDSSIGPFPPVLIMGAIGGLVSIYLRMQDVDLRSRNFSSLMELRYGLMSAILAPFFGAVFSGLLFLLVAGGLLTGALFPAITLPASVPENGFQAFFLQTALAKQSDIAKLLIWSFLAGFAERLVPNMLKRLASEVDKPKGN